MKNKLFLCLIVTLSIFSLVGCDSSEYGDDNNYQYNDKGEKVDNIGWTKEDWDRYHKIIENSDN